MRVAGIVWSLCPILIERVRSWDGPILRDREPLRPGTALARAPWTLVPNFCGALNAVAGRGALVESESGFPHKRAFLRHTHPLEGKKEATGTHPPAGGGLPRCQGAWVPLLPGSYALKNFRSPPLFDYPAGEW